MCGLIELALLTDASLLHSLMYKQQHDQDLSSTHKRERLCGPAPASEIRSTHHSADSKGYTDRSVWEEDESEAFFGVAALLEGGREGEPVTLK